MRAEPVTESNLYLFHEGTQTRAYAVFGAHPAERDGRQGTRFSLWAPHAENIWIEGDFNDAERRSLIEEAHKVCTIGNSYHASIDIIDGEPLA